ncbi:MAG: DegQ family serine endoprotease [Gammaproteobacteria bacterium]|nr:DegQ family serine endoprotease [Gammaproteobacteria bacterium]
MLFAPPGARARDLPEFTQLADSNSPSVVNISVTPKEGAGLPHMFGMPDIPEDSPMYEFFRKFLEQMPEDRRPRPERATSGSGFIIAGDGYVITNAHVVKDGAEIIVRLFDRRELKAELVGMDDRSDIAVLKVDANGLPAVRLGDSSRLRVGEWVLAIGSPFGFERSVTAGIVSAIGRSLPNENYIPFIQTDVAINPGNSGGPLFNLDGEVVGVNSQIYSRTGGYMGLSFAVPINVAQDVYRQLRDTGRVSRGWLGVLIQDVTRELAESFKMERPQGALVSRVLQDSPAAEAGIEVGDVIVKFNGREIGNSSELPPLVGAAKIGARAGVDIVRRGRNINVQVTVAELPDQPDMGKAEEQGKRPMPADNPLNVEVQDPTEAQRKELELTGSGVFVSAVHEGPAADAGMQRGDVILMINGTKVASVSQFNALVKELPPDRSIPVLVQRRGNPIFLALRIPK